MMPTNYGGLFGPIAPHTLTNGPNGQPSNMMTPDLTGAGGYGAPNQAVIAPPASPSNPMGGQMMYGAPIAQGAAPGPTPGATPPMGYDGGMSPQNYSAAGAPAGATQPPPSHGLFAARAPTSSLSGPGMSYATAAMNPMALEGLRQAQAHPQAYAQTGAHAPLFSPQGLQQLLQGYGHEINGTLGGVGRQFQALFGGGQAPPAQQGFMQPGAQIGAGLGALGQGPGSY